MVKDLSVELCGLRLQNPVIPASGTFGFGLELADTMDLNVLGAISLKGTTREARYGNPTPRIAEGYSGMLNSVGLQNPGIDVLVNEKAPALRKIYRQGVIANISGFSVEEYRECCAKADACEGIDLIEVNVSCPNVHGGGLAFGTSAAAAAEVTAAVKAVCRKPVFIKLSPNVTDIVAIARAAEDEGADAVSLINTLMGMAIDAEHRRRILSIGTGGLSGPAVKPVALRMVWQVAHAVHIPVIGLGGISTATDAVEFLLAGARAVEIGTANFIDPAVSLKVVRGIDKYLERHGFKSVNEIIGLCE